MRLWSLHPQYLDAAGLTACWREGLLARKVLSGETAGYRHHPQLERFKTCSDPLVAIDTYLQVVLTEARRRGYRFDAQKIGTGNSELRIPVTQGQLDFEFSHLTAKLSGRAPEHLFELMDVVLVEPHPLFVVVPGETETWEVVK